MTEQLKTARGQLEVLEAHLTLIREGAATANETPRQLAERLLKLVTRIRANVAAAQLGLDCTRQVAVAAGVQVRMLLERFAEPDAKPAGAGPADQLVGLRSETRIYGVRHPGKPQGQPEPCNEKSPHPTGGIGE